MYMYITNILDAYGVLAREEERGRLEERDVCERENETHLFSGSSHSEVADSPGRLFLSTEVTLLQCCNYHWYKISINHHLQRKRER